MSLMFKDRSSWRRWQASRRRLHTLKDKLSLGTQTSDAHLDVQLWARGSTPRLLIACDSNSPTNHYALLSPLEADTTLDVVVVAPSSLELELPGSGWAQLDARGRFDGIRAVASIGDHLAVGAWAGDFAQAQQIRQLVVQHGLLTPFSPPPPPDVEWLAWSDADAEFIKSGRPDIDTRVTGSAMLAAAASNPARHVSRFETPVFLGQLHGAELSRVSMTRSVTSFWRMTGASYRPHPREEDKLSRLQHAAWEQAGMEIQRDNEPLRHVGRPVVSAFSTGVLEAAAQGIPSWVYHRNPPTWLEEFWDRYNMSRWGGLPTPPPELASADAAQRIAHLFREAST